MYWLITGLFLALGLAGHAADTNGWQETRSTHFIVRHTGDEPLARGVAERAEAYYSSIAADLGYTRYQKFWLWDNRVKILIYPTAQAFATACNAPAWAAGRASHERHEIATYRQSGPPFLADLLPHELSHLVLGDFIGRERIPLWLSEGFAQWEESRDHTPPNPSCLPLRFTLHELMAADIRTDPDTTRVALFYTQSASLVGFLIRSHGGEAFGAFCRALRDGKPVEAALITAYPGAYPSLDVLEQKWLK